MQNKSLRVRYIVSMLSILIPVLLFSMVILIYNANNNRRQMESDISNNFTRAVTSIDSLLDTMDQLIEKHFMQRSNWLWDAPDMNFYLTQSVANIQNALGAKAEVYCYLRGGQDVASATQIMSYQDFEQLFQSGYNLNYERYFTSLMRIVSPKLMHISALQNHWGDNMVIYLYPVLFPENQTSFVISFMMKERDLAAIIDEYMGDIAGDVYLYTNADGTMLLERHSLDEPLIPIADMYKYKGVGFFADSQRGLAVVRQLSYRGLTCVMVVEQNDVSYMFWKNSLVLIVLIIALLISCVGLAVMIALFNYHPIRDLAQELSSKHALGRNANELFVIRESFLQTEEEKEALAVQLESQNTLLMEQLCVKLATGSVTDMDELDYLAKCANITFPYPAFAALYLRLPLNHLGTIDALINCCHVFSVAQGMTISGELFRESAVCMMINFLPGPEGAQQRKREIVQKLQHFLQDRLADVIIGVGNTYGNPLRMHDSYLEAVAATLYAQQLSPQYLFFYDEDSASEKANDAVEIIPKMPKLLLMESIKQGDLAMAQRNLDDITAWIRNEPTSKLFSRLRYIDMVNTILESVSTFNIAPDSKQLAQLMSTDAIEPFSDGLHAMLVDLCAQVRERLALSDIQSKKALLDFIAEHYMETNFSLQMVIDGLRISKNRINSILKEDVGMGFAQYTSWLRMNLFRRLLVETNRSIQDLVAEVGYVDVSNFLRKFKSLEGVTAGQYRARHAARASSPKE